MAIKKGQMTDNGTGDILYPETSYDMVTDKPTTFLPSSHNHDDRYYTENEINTKLTAKLDTNGNASNVTNTFTQSSSLVNLTTGEKLSVSLGKVMKAIVDLISHIGNKSNPHTVTKAQVGLSNVTNDAQVKRSEMGVSNGVATLDTTGKVPSAQLPSYVDDVLEYTNKSSFPGTGETGKIYIDKTTNITYRWGGTAYVEISPSLALGETSSTAYAGNKGKATTDNVNAILAGTKVVPKATDANTLDGKDSTAFANASHTHTKSQISDFPTSMKNPNALNIKLNDGVVEGTDKFTYDGSAVKNINITADSIGALAKSDFIIGRATLLYENTSQLSIEMDTSRPVEMCIITAKSLVGSAYQQVSRLVYEIPVNGNKNKIKFKAEGNGFVPGHVMEIGYLLMLGES